MSSDPKPADPGGQPPADQPDAPAKFSDEFKEFARYLFFLGLVCAVLFGARKSSDAYYMRQSLDDMFLGNEYDYGISFEDTASLSQVWQWIDSIALPNIYPDAWYNGNERTNEDKRTVTDVTAYRVGLARLRAVRVQEGGCEVSQYFSKVTSECYPAYTCGSSSATESQDDWVNPKPRTADWTNPAGPHVDHKVIPFRETEESAFYSAKTTVTYCSGGQVVDLGDSYQNASAQVRALWNSTWIDRSTRALFLEFNLYNPNTDMFAIFRSVMEFLPSGAIVPTYSISCLPLIRPLRVYRSLFEGDDYTTGTTAAMFLLEWILYFLVFFYIYGEALEARSNGLKAYMSNGWNVLDITNYTLFVVVMLLRVQGLQNIDLVSGKLASTDEYLEELTMIADDAKLVENLNAFNAVISFMKTFKYVRYNKKLSQFIDTVTLTCIETISLMVIIAITILAYAIAFNLGYGGELISYRDFAHASFTLFKSMLGDMDLDELLTGTNRVLGPVLFGTFVPLMFFVILSMFLAIVDKSYETVREGVEASASEPDHQFNSDVAYVVRFPARMVNLAKDFLVKKLYAMEKLSPLVEEEEEELGVESKQEELLTEDLAEVVEEESASKGPQDPCIAHAALYRKALAFIEDLQENQDKLEQMLEDTEARLNPAAAADKDDS